MFSHRFQCFLIFSLNELKKWKIDQFVNSKPVTLRGGKHKKRGDVIPGDIIEIRNNEEAPCDLIVLYAQSQDEKERERVIFSQNEATVTGENKPVRKITCLKRNEILKKLEIS